MGERASSAIWTISTTFVKLALYRFVIVCTVLEVTLEVLVSLGEAILLLLYHSTTSTVTSWHLLRHSSLSLEVLLTLEIASTSSVVTWHAILMLLKASSHIIPLLIVASHVSTLRPVIIDWHSPHSCSFHMFRNWLEKLNQKLSIKNLILQHWGRGFQHLRAQNDMCRPFDNSRCYQNVCNARSYSENL